MNLQYSMSNYQRRQLFLKQKEQEQEQRNRATDERIFWEFNPHKALPNPLPHNYHLNRLTQPPIYIRSITESPDIQRRLIKKIICLVDSTLEEYQVPCPRLLQNALKIKEIASDLSRKLDIDLTRARGFQTVTGEKITQAIAQVMDWKNDVCLLMEAIQQIDLKAKQESLARKKTAQMSNKPIEVVEQLQTSTSSSLHVASPTPHWTPSISAAAKALQLAVEQREAEEMKHASRPS